jgi:hypothetical protein
MVGGYGLGSFNFQSPAQPWGSRTVSSGSGTSPLASEPIESRAESYKSPGDNSSPAGETIAAIIGTSAFDGKIVWWDGFKLKNNKVIASFAMVFTDCIFTTDAALLKLFADEQLITSNVEPTRQSSQKIRFYDGSQTAVDPLLTERLGAANATAWPGFVYMVCEDFDCSLYGNRIPLMRAVLSGAVTDTAGQETQSSLNFGAFGVGYVNTAFTVDSVRGLHYQIVQNGNDDAYIVTVDIATMEEINRVQVFGITGFGLITFPVALEGSDFIACAVTGPDLWPGVDTHPALLNILTGELVDSLAIVQGGGFGGVAIWRLAPSRATLLSSGVATKYLVTTQHRMGTTAVSNSDIALFIADVTNGTLDWIIHPILFPAAGEFTGNNSVEFGPVVDGVATVWYTTLESGITSINVALVSDTAFTSGAFYIEVDAAKDIMGIAYDHGRSVLVASRNDGSWLKLNAVTGAVLATVSGSGDGYYLNLGTVAESGDDYAALYSPYRNGYAVGVRVADTSGYTIGIEDIYEINLSTLEATLMVDQSDFSNDSEAKYFDPFRGVQTEGSDVGAGIINKVTLGGATPDTVDLQDIFSQLATFDDRFEAGDLSFSGFPGNETSGLKLENDTTVDNLEQSIAEIFDAKIVPSDGGRKYFYPARDGSFALTATLAATDFVERGSEAVEKTFGAGEDEFIGCSVAYNDVDFDYKKLEQSYARPVGLYDVSRSKKKRTFNTTLSLTAGQASELATTMVFRSVLGNETYSFSLVPGKSHLEPGDYLSIPFRDGTAIVRIKEATLNADYTQAIVAYQYLQFADAVFTGGGLEEEDETIFSIATRLIYLDIPLMSYAHDLDGDGLVQYVQIGGIGPGIINAAAYKSSDGVAYSNLGTRSDIAPITGAVVTVTGYPVDPSVTDTTNTITVNISSGDIDEIVAGDRAAIGRPGRWCVVTFDSISVTDGQIELSDLDWGYENGSEVWRDQIAAGDQFVLIDAEHYIRFNHSISVLDDTFYYKSADVTVAIGTVPTLAHAAAGVAETPYAPVNLAAVVDGSDIDITWDYRSRLATGLNPATHGEATLAFEIDIMGTDSPLSVLRTLTATTNAVTYTAAQIATDFGGIPSFMTFRVYMMSALDILVPGQTIAGVGRGYVAEKTVQLDAVGVPMGLLLTLTYPT